MGGKLLNMLGIMSSSLSKKPHWVLTFTAWLSVESKVRRTNTLDFIVVIKKLIN